MKKLLKKLLLATTLMIGTTVAATTAHADQYKMGGTHNSALTGFYIGALAGYTNADADAGALSPEVSGGDYGIFTGYKLGRVIDNNMGINAAIEAHYAWSDADGSDTGVSYEKNHEWGVSFRPGFSMNEALNPYGIIGYKQAQFEGNAGVFSGEEDFHGFELGLGAELVSYGDWGVRAEYAHTWYGDESGIDLDEDTIRGGVAYHF